MKTDLVQELKSLLATSDAKLRKHWAKRIIGEKIPVKSLMSLLHGEEKTAQRFTWLIGDLLEQNPDSIVPCVSLLFSLRDQMPFPGMRRSVAKCLWLAPIPTEIEEEAIEQLFEWLRNNDYSIGCKHYSSKALYKLATQRRIDKKNLAAILGQQSKHANPAHAARMKKMRQTLSNV